MPANVSCHGCGNTFYARRSDAFWCPECKPGRNREKAYVYESRKKIPCPKCGAPMGRRAKLCHPCDNRRRSVCYPGKSNPNWRGGKTTTRGGYIRIRVNAHKVASKAYRLEHHVNWEKAHGKPLPKGWVVHHFNGIKDDNRPENLLGISRRDHHTQHRAYEARIRQLEEEVRSLRQLRLAG